MTSLSAPTRGLFIVVEGLDKAGKSSQCTRLVSNLQRQGRSVHHMRFPDRTTPTGKIIDTYLKGETQQDDRAVHLIFSANRWEAAEQIRTDIKAGTTVVVDRYVYSGCVYSAAKEIQGMDLEWTYWPEVGLPRPDICLFLEISVEIAGRRGDYGGERYEDQQMQGKVRKLFEQIRHGRESDEICVIDASGTESEVEATIFRTIQECAEQLPKTSHSHSIREFKPRKFVQISSLTS